MRNVRYTKTTRERLIELLENIGFKVTRQSSDGMHMLLRTPDGKATDYWIFTDSIQHKLDNYRGGTSFYYSDVYFETDKKETVALIGRENKSMFMQFHNFDTNKKDK